MNKLTYLSIALIFGTLLSCSSSKKAVENGENHRFGVSFYSIGSGIDVPAKKSYVEFLREFEEKNKVKLIYEVSLWGLEGESNLCFNLNELSKKDQINFIKESKENLKACEHVHFKENEPCKIK